ncbi:Hypothetical predicted protein [Cloeon dipterum]|uniref:APOPT family protein CG14806, mitochondrial n=1 Tax=Cloeon dipterum TaxID=197152 RepID=A0A8S1CDA1_9INSE|nr:Hypothetical predicted protein [Cloeon dipterum]
MYRLRQISIKTANLNPSCSALLKRAAATGPNSSSKHADGSSFVIQAVGEKDMVGPPDKVSNIRPIRFHIPANESPVEKEYRLTRQEVLQWNQDFWSNHNTKFLKERNEFIENEQRKKCNNDPLSADEMSVFYKQFLDNNWQVHVKYNAEWYKKNIGLMLQSFKILVLKSFGRLNRSS